MDTKTDTEGEDMKYMRTSWKGLLFIVVLMALNAFLWLSAEPIIGQTLESTIGQMMGANLLLWFTLVFFLATKNRFVTWLFTGLENVYATHRWLALITVLAIFLHAQLSYLIVYYFRADLPIDPAFAGRWARNLFIGLTIVALLAKYLKYEHWRYIHRLLLIPYLIAVYHAFALSAYDLLSFSLLGVWMMAMVLVGLLSSVYMIFVYRRTAFVHQGRVVKKTMAAPDVTEVEVELDGPYTFKTGQFAFVKIAKPPFNGVSHPFSISGRTASSIFFTIKALGDFTEAIKDHLEKGDIIRITKPYGHMTFDDAPSPQVWLAGGIGITPFLSHLRSLEKPDQHITLYYSVRTKEEAVHVEYLRELAKKWDNFTFHFSESDKDGFLQVADLDLTGRPGVFLCGPVPMAKALKKQFKGTDRHRFLEYEAFSFTGTLAEDVIRQAKKLYRKMKPS